MIAFPVLLGLLAFNSSYAFIATPPNICVNSIHLINKLFGYKNKINFR